MILHLELGLLDAVGVVSQDVLAVCIVGTPWS